MEWLPTWIQEKFEDPFNWKQSDSEDEPGEKEPVKEPVKEPEKEPSPKETPKREHRNSLADLFEPLRNVKTRLDPTRSMPPSVQKAEDHRRFSIPAIQDPRRFSLQNSEGGGSSSSSPYHRTLSGESDGAGALDMVPIDIPELPAPTYGEKLGKIQFSLHYNFQEMTLTLKIIRAMELPAKDFSGTSDPYVKILLLPDKKSKLQTNIKRKNLNPRWNEVFAFEGFPYSKLMNRTLYLQVLDYDRFSRDDPIGEICLPLGDVDLGQGETMWKTLQPCKGHTAGKLGELLLSLCYQPTVGRITVVVIKARELKAKDINGLSDPYVKIWMCHDGKKVEKKKTTIKEKNLNPVFNESFIFNVPYERIRQTSLNISVMDYDRMGRNELIGQIILGSKSGPMEVKHWNEMFAKSRTPVAQWHILKDFG